MKNFLRLPSSTIKALFQLKIRIPDRPNNKKIDKYRLGARENHENSIQIFIVPFRSFLTFHILATHPWSKMIDITEQTKEKKMTLNPHLPVCMAGSPAGLTEHPLHLYPLKEDAVGCQGLQVGRPHGGVEEELGVGCQQL